MNDPPPQPLPTPAGFSSVSGTKAVALFIFVLGASVSMTLLTDYIEGDLGYQQPYVLAYVAQSCMVLLIPIRLWHLSWTTNIPVSRYIVELKYTLAQQFPKPSTPGINYRALLRTVFISTIGYTAGAVLWYLCVVFAPIADVTALWSTNAFWTYILSVMASSYWINLAGRQEHKWEFRKLLAVSMASVGVAAVVYGGSHETKQPERVNGSGDGNPNSTDSWLVLLGDGLALGSALATAAWAVWYDQSVALPEDGGSRPPTPQSSDGVDAIPSEYQPLRTDDRRTPSTVETIPTTNVPFSLPFGFHANFFSWTVGIITLFVFWIPLALINIMKLGPRVELPPSLKVWFYVGLISVTSLIYNAGSLVLLYVWGPVLTAVASLLTIVLVLMCDVLFGNGMQTLTAGTLLGSTMIVGAFGLTGIPRTRYLSGLRWALARQLANDPTNASPPLKYAKLYRLIVGLTLGVTCPAVLWYVSVAFAPISDVTALFNTNAFWAYVLSVIMASSERSQIQWEWKKLLAVTAACGGVFAVVYGGAQSDHSETRTNTTLGAGSTIFGDGLALASSMCYALYQVLYKRYAVLEPDDDPNRTPSPQTNDITGPYQPLLTDEYREVTPPRSPEGEQDEHIEPHSIKPPFGFYPNFITTMIGVTTLLVLWIPIPVMHWLGVVV
ncbi:hypothetical protein FRB90_012494 [Tulasnella sp. 427]|nr:hypothetical protein FRB90_012494 [Tulasnella sp. 427]